MKEYYKYEELGITVVKKLNKRKIAILISIFIILDVLLIYVFTVNQKMKKIAIENEKQISSGESEIKEDNEQKVQEDENEKENKTRLPQLTEIGKEKINNIYKSDEKIAYLTFDDGPSSKVTPQILKILDDYNIKATFFLLGKNVERYPELVKEEYEKGHYLANHGYTHEYAEIYSSAESIIDEYNKTEQTIKDALGIQEYSSHLFRYPGGTGGSKYREVKDKAKQLLAESNVLYINWNALTNDSVGKPTAESIVKNLKDTVGEKNSVVILMHDAAAKQLTADTLPEIIDYLIEKGYSFKNFYDIVM